MYRIHQIILRLGEDKDSIPSKIAKKTRNSEKSIKEWKIVKESVDAREKNDVKMVYTVDFSCEGKANAEKAPDMTYRPVDPTGTHPGKRPVITGSGPCGMFAALILSEAGFAPLVIERGRSVEDRIKDVKGFKEKGILDEESNVQFGEGGAGTFSDGKLYSGIKDKRIRKVLETFYEAGAGHEILYKQKPHIGTDRLRLILPEIRSRIIKNGGEIRFSSKLTEIHTENGKLKYISVNDEEEIETDDLILAQGQSAYDTISMLYKKGLIMEQKAFSIGIRIQHEQRMIDEAQWGSSEKSILLGPAEYRLSGRCRNKRGVYTFCMCPGGEVIPAASSNGHTVINGMSNSSRDGK
nr:NAD(FAD)-utilizing dehydrogenase [Bacillota bacterium]